MSYEIYVEEDFISKDERLAIKQKVLELRPYWTDHRPEWYSGVEFNTLGNALYTMYAAKLTAADIDQQVRSLLIENFSWLYERICNKIAVMTGHPAKIHDALTVPGFHIGYKPSDREDTVLDFYHNDSTILFYDEESSMDTTRSILVAIDKSAPGAYLLYLDKGQECRLDYKLGAFHHWDSRMDHKAGGLKILPDEYRITLQCHYYYNARMQCNLVYF
jgi:hypothetical protein